MIKKIRLILGMLLCFQITFIAEANDSLKEVSLILDWTPNTNHTGFYVAREKGYFEDEGLRLLIKQPSDTGGDILVSAGKAEFAVSFQEYVTFGLAKGLDIVSIAAIIQNNTAGFASLKDRNIRRPIDFAGKTYCGYGSDVETAIVRQMFQLDKKKALKEGMNVPGSPDDIQIITSYDSLFSDSKDCDFFWIFEGWQGVRAKMEKIAFNNILMRNYSPAFNYYTPVIITGNALITKDKSLVRSFLAAVEKGYEFAIANPVEAAKILSTEVPELDAEFVKASQLYLSGVYRKGSKKWGIQKRKVWEDFNEFAFEQKLIKKKISVDQAFTNELIE